MRTTSRKPALHAGCLVVAPLLILAGIATCHAGPAGLGRAVVLSLPGDRYRPLALEIASEESLPIANGFDAAFRSRPEFLIWVVAPDRLSEQVFSRFGGAMLRYRGFVSVGLISGGTEEAARALWRRQPARPEPLVSIVPREGRIEVTEHGSTRSLSPDKSSVVAQLARAGYVMYQGHGTRRLWQIHRPESLMASEVPRLSGQTVAAGACQTFKRWSEASIALAFADRGAAAYAGFAHTPFGCLMDDPKGFPFRLTHRAVLPRSAGQPCLGL